MLYRRVALLGLLTLLVAPSPAHATFPGQNGKIAFTGGAGISVINADGTGMNLQVTDKESGIAATGVDFPISAMAPCTTTPADNTGSNCAVQTTADAIRPGLVPEGQRSIWELGQIEVRDQGADGDVAKTQDNLLVAKQGIFIP